MRHSRRVPIFPVRELCQRPEVSEFSFSLALDRVDSQESGAEGRLKMKSVLWPVVSARVCDFLLFITQILA